MKKKDPPKIENCKKCKSEALLKKTDSLLLFIIKCSNCDNKSETCCSSDETIRNWNGKNGK